MQLPETGDSWLGLTEARLPVDEVLAWAGRPDCGAVVLFCGNARDHSVGRSGVNLLDYEAYDEQVVPRLAAIEAALREQWPALGRVAMLHRTGPLAVGDTAVVVAVSSPHRGEAFAAGSYAIDTLKSTVPIWKREVWQDGESWGLEAQHITTVDVTVDQ